MGKPVGIGIAVEAPSSTCGTENVVTLGVERRLRYGSQAMDDKQKRITFYRPHYRL